jgi:hypothetical protein
MKKLSNSSSNGVRPEVASKLKFNAARSISTSQLTLRKLVALYAKTGNLRISTLMTTLLCSPPLMKSLTTVMKNKIRL